MNRRQLIGGATALLAIPQKGHAASNFRVLPEEHRHEATFMMWPASRRVHPDRWFLDHLQKTIARVANAIAEFEDVILLADAGEHGKIRKRVSARVSLWDIPTEDLWARDAGPIFVSDGRQRAVSHIKFNGWGGKQVHRHDGKVAERVARRLGFQLRPTGLKGEAGGVEQDGHGLLLAHESSWVNRNRNPGLDRDEVGKRLLTAYGADQIIWSKGVYGQDITDYHIDSLARFTRAGRVLINLPKSADPSDPFHRAAAETTRVCRNADLNVETIFEPEFRRVKSYDFVASYMNYYVCNGAVIAAEFGDRNADRAAVKALARHYPGRQIVTLNVDALGEVGGGIHCATQQLPRA